MLLLTSSFATTWKRKKQFLCIITIYRQIGMKWKVFPVVQHQLEAFTCVMYGQARECSVNAVRSKLLKKMVGEHNTPFPRVNLLFDTKDDEVEENGENTEPIPEQSFHIDYDGVCFPLIWEEKHPFDGYFSLYLLFFLQNGPSYG